MSKSLSRAARINAQNSRPARTASTQSRTARTQRRELRHIGQTTHTPPEKPKQAKKAKKDSDIKTLAKMCLAAFVLLGVILGGNYIPGFTFNMGALFKDDRPEYKLGEVALGSAMKTLNASQPGAKLIEAPDGSLALSFMDKGDRYVVWHGNDGNEQVAYKAKQTTVISGMTEEDHVATLATRYGSPSVSTCTRSIIDNERDCQFRWWIASDLRIDMISTQDANGTLTISTTATDTRLEGRIRKDKLQTTHTQN